MSKNLDNLNELQKAAKELDLTFEDQEEIIEEFDLLLSEEGLSDTLLENDQELEGLEELEELVAPTKQQKDSSVNKEKQGFKSFVEGIKKFFSEFRKNIINVFKGVFGNKKSKKQNAELSESLITGKDKVGSGQSVETQQKKFSTEYKQVINKNRQVLKEGIIKLQKIYYNNVPEEKKVACQKLFAAKRANFNKMSRQDLIDELKKTHRSIGSQLKKRMSLNSVKKASKAYRPPVNRPFNKSGMGR